MARKEWKPDFADCVKQDEEILRAKLAMIRAGISHPGEKGTSVECQVIEFLRSFLPKEYGLSTGFIAYHSSCISGGEKRPRYNSDKDRIMLSSQLDVIIYDALRFGPLQSLGSCDVFPLEAVFGYVEVKTQMHSPDMIRDVLKQSHRLRRMQTKFYQAPVKDTYTRTVLVAGARLMSIRSFVFALDAPSSLGDHLEIKQKIDNQLERTKGFLSGMYIQGRGFFRSHHAESDDDPLIGTIEASGPETSLLAFKLSLLSALSRFPRIQTNWVPAIHTYYETSAPSGFLHTKPLPGQEKAIG